MESTFCAEPCDDFRLIETFRWSPQQGAVRLDLHLARLAQSADDLGFPFRMQRAVQAVSALREPTPLRCRFELFQNGGLVLTTVELTPEKPEWTLSVSPDRLTATDKWLRYKTTHRALYDHTRATLPQGVDEVVFLNTVGEVCEGTITNLFATVENGVVLTPALECGVLPGVLRQELIAQGYVKEARLSLTDLQDAQALQMGNSLRGLIPAKLINS